MNKLLTAMISTGLLLAGTHAFAEDSMMKPSGAAMKHEETKDMKKDGMSHKRKHIMRKKEGMKKDSMKKDGMGDKGM